MANDLTNRMCKKMLSSNNVQRQNLKKNAYSTNPEKTTVNDYECHSPKSNWIDCSWALSMHKCNMF